MSIPEQAGIVLRCVEVGQLSSDSVIRWADSVIATCDVPEPWLIELSLLDTKHFADVVIALRQHGNPMQTVEIDIYILAELFFSGRRNMQEMMEQASHACFAGDSNVSRTLPFERLGDLLAEWDQLDLPDPERGDWRSRLSSQLRECQQSSPVVSMFVSQLFAA
jgi:hypothetical protein